MERCTHTDQIRDVQPSAQGCEECLEIGDTWVHLRECLVCATSAAATHRSPGVIGDEAMNRIERDLDLEESHLEARDGMNHWLETTQS